VFREIRKDVDDAKSRPSLTELYKRAGYLITLTYAPSWDKKCAALARALALDPELLFLDEPTSGPDPTAEFDELIATLQRTLGLTVFMVTHDLDSLYSICDRIIALADRKVIAMSAMLASQHPWLRAYFHGKRARRIESALALQANESSMKEANGGGRLPGRL
jgi:phospholipid/cholesterol/gamma-HCH transport system ATP-binding protein